MSKICVNLIGEDVCYTAEELEQYTRQTAGVSPEYPVTIDRLYSALSSPSPEIG